VREKAWAPKKTVEVGWGRVRLQVWLRWCRMLSCSRMPALLVTSCIPLCFVLNCPAFLPS
jgi:ABC-type transport system involved in cytochrome c biogenesis permease subunit